MQHNELCSHAKMNIFSLKFSLIESRRLGMPNLELSLAIADFQVQGGILNTMSYLRDTGHFSI